MAERNQSEAENAFFSYHHLLRRKLAIVPTAALRALVASLLP